MDYQKLQKLFAETRLVKVAYLFGSRANSTAGALSDYDFAVYLDEKDAQKRFSMKLRLIKELSEILQTNAVDIVVLNDAKSPELKYNIIKEGVLLYEEEPFKVIIEPNILNDYFDFHSSLRQYGLTKA